MHESGTYVEDFKGKQYVVRMSQHQAEGPWTIKIQLRDEEDKPIGGWWDDADNTYATKAAAQMAGSAWAEEQLT